ncbi:MAG TPA: hypothetical protein DCR21_02215 [Succinivibrionaceae bacterium]|nr:hypothetical protein [Succinivibrionaceae bacterium]
MSEKEISQNLSEVLFKPKFNYPETSVISNSGTELTKVSDKLKTFGFMPDWYRPIHLFSWTLQGGNCLDIEEALANIATSTKERSRPQCFDTVKEYGSGNWIYEFSAIGQRRLLKAKSAEEKNDLLDASHQYRMAARYFAIAAYPYLRGDVLAADADLQSRRAYRSMFKCDPNNGELLEEQIDIGQDKPVTGYLHIPDKNTVQPCLVLAGSYESHPCDFYRLYDNFLRERGIAMFTVEMPGQGASDKLNLNANSSVVIEAAIRHLAKVSCIDSSNIAIMGLNIGANAAMRAAILNEKTVKALVLITPAVNSLFTDSRILDNLPLCLRSLYANRLGIDAGNWESAKPLFKTLSLKTQGLLSSSGGCKVPCYTIEIDSSATTKEDLNLIRNNFSSCEVDEMKDINYSQFINKAFVKAFDFIKDKFSGQDS